MRKQILRAIAFLAMIVSSIGAAQAITYDISTDFSTTSNPKGVWTYGFFPTVGDIPTLGGTLTLYDQQLTDGSGIQIWRSSTVQSLGAPADFNNPTGSDVTTCGSCSPLSAHTAAFHPGPSGEYSVYRFTTPSSGIYMLDATFGGIDHGGTDVHILDNGSVIYSANITGGSTSSLSQSLTLGSGELIDFAVGFGTGSDRDFFFDSTSINASLTIEAIPEPEIYAMMGIGLALMGFVARRKRGRREKAAT